MLVRSFVRSSVPFMEFITKFDIKVSEMGLSRQPHISKHSYLGHGFLGGSAYVP